MATALGRAARGHHLEGIRSVAAAAFTLNRWLKRDQFPSLNKTCYSFFAKKEDIFCPTPTDINMEKFYRNINALLDFSFYFKHSISMR